MSKRTEREYDDLRPDGIDLLVRAKTVGNEIHIVVAQLANQYGIAPRYVEEKLVELHNNKIIRLSAYYETGVVKPLSVGVVHRSGFPLPSEIDNFRRLQGCKLEVVRRTREILCRRGSG